MNARMRFAGKMAGIHFGICLLVAAIVAALVLFVWYPHPFRQVMGGMTLFTLVVCIDVVCGPLLTFVLANPAKKRTERILDFSLIGLIQIAALCYGMYVVYQARPAILAFEGERLRIGTVNSIYSPEWDKASVGLQKVPLFGLLKVVALPGKTQEDKMRDVELAMQGFDIGYRPSRWIPYTEGKAIIREKAKLWHEFSNLLSEKTKNQIKKQTKKYQQDDLYYLPLLTEDFSEWIAVLNEEMVLLEIVSLP